MNRLFLIPILLRQLLIALLFLFSVVGFSNAMATEKPTANLSSGCIERYDQELDYFPEKATLDYAKGFTLEYFKHYKVVTVTTPWPNAQESFRYVLVQCGAPVPEGFAGDANHSIPIRSIAILSTTHLPHLEILDALDRLVRSAPSRMCILRNPAQDCRR
jgi:iron complex transport system substrate-binding protein